jgi:pheromone shutdown protein TraB
MNRVALGFMKRVVQLRNARGQTVHLLGTAHVSERSRVEVKDLITHIKPGVVFVEICEQRKPILDEEDSENKKMTLAESLDALRTGEMNAFSLLMMYLMKAYNLKPGMEFRAAAQTAKELGDIPVVLGDRMISITMMRFWGGLSVWDKFRLIKSLFEPEDNSDDKEGTHISVSMLQPMYTTFKVCD